MVLRKSIVNHGCNLPWKEWTIIIAPRNMYCKISIFYFLTDIIFHLKKKKKTCLFLFWNGCLCMYTCRVCWERTPTPLSFINFLSTTNTESLRAFWWIGNEARVSILWKILRLLILIPYDLETKTLKLVKVFFFFF